MLLHSVLEKLGGIKINYLGKNQGLLLNCNKKHGV